jgi:hypothetical protein
MALVAKVLPAILSAEDIQEENSMKFAFAISLLLFSACSVNHSTEKSEYFLFLNELKKIESGNFPKIICGFSN